MNKGIKKVRKSINQRKKMRGLNPKDKHSKQFLPSFPQEEEKHGYFPIFTDNTSTSKNTSQRVSGFAVKGILSVMLFFGTALLFQTDAELLIGPKKWTGNALTEEFPFASVNQWYQETFGAPMALAPNQNQNADEGQSLALPVSGSVSESFQANGTGILIAPEKASNISSLREGVVIFAGNDKETDKTVIVQHADNSKTIYGYLSAVDVHLYQFVNKNEDLGKFTPSADNEMVYFAIEKDNEYVDPVQVIKVDDSP
ncbi:stage IV sporulation protein FA [Virgibacillus subterraneus]|uniref:Stage IV sporulation protein FA n=2 Tax=Virgibacillus TaxID=84406 RepID=A0A1H1B356_9BACI|nr:MULTISPECIES: M23 family metallopeptidase [Virgibacillus]SDQ46375.1 stage IV sporulation protein FA [Virgibacillus salinus]SEQ14717.1 stage IV sporulation protein FA [Virgibacillus subterraneus]